MNDRAPLTSTFGIRRAILRLRWRVTVACPQVADRRGVVEPIKVLLDFGRAACPGTSHASRLGAVEKGLACSSISFAIKWAMRLSRAPSRPQAFFRLPCKNRFRP